MRQIFAFVLIIISSSLSWLTSKSQKKSYFNGCQACQDMALKSPLITSNSRYLYALSRIALSSWSYGI